MCIRDRKWRPCCPPRAARSRRKVAPIPDRHSAEWGSWEGTSSLSSARRPQKPLPARPPADHKSIRPEQYSPQLVRTSPQSLPEDCPLHLSLIHISEPTRLRRISYAVFCLKK